MIPRPGDEITCVIHDRMGRYVLRTSALRVEPPSPDNSGRPRVRYGEMDHEWVNLKEEGITWCRGWGDVEALLAASVLSRSASK